MTNLFNSFKENEISAIDKFICEALNYDSVICCGYIVPRFVAECNWTCDREHMVEKWRNLCANGFIQYYTSLDNENKKIMLNWIIENREKGWL